MRDSGAMESQESLEALAVRAVLGDRDALRRVVEGAQGPVFRLSLRMLTLPRWCGRPLPRRAGRRCIGAYARIPGAARLRAQPRGVAVVPRREPHAFTSGRARGGRVRWAPSCGLLTHAGGHL